MSKTDSMDPRELGWFRFKLGEFECTAVWDGTLYQPYEGIYPNADWDELRALMKKYGLPQDNIPMDLNVLIVNTGSDIILVDPGMGTGDIFGDGMGHMPANLAAAGVDPDDVSLVLITHLHPDHAWGLVDGKGAPIFDKALLGVTRLDWDYWTDEAKLECDDHRASWVKGTLESVAPYRDRMVWVEDDKEIVPGARAKLTPGHSPGHSAFLFQSAGDSLMSLGDCTHHAVYEVQHPEWYYSLDYDTIPDRAVESRRMIYNLVVEGKHRAMGYHFPWPGIGHIERKDETFEFFPI